MFARRSEASLSISRFYASEARRPATATLDPASKRVFDLALSMIALLILAPVLFLMTLAIYLDSGRAILFKQLRPGFRGAPFTIYKFRTLEGRDLVRQLDLTPDNRTRLGAFLRRSGAEAFPQLWNVVRGDLSIVGPRPHATWHEAEFDHHVRDYSLRFRTKPGITGLAQVNGARGRATIELIRRRLDYDLAYIRSWSLWLDASIVARTAALMLADCWRAARQR